jgi:sterol 3beta-glucosyltransferase
MNAAADIDNDLGKINISLDLKSKLPDLPPDYALDVVDPSTEISSTTADYPMLNIVIFIIGSRGMFSPSFLNSSC